MDLRQRSSFRHRVKSFLFINLLNQCVYKIVCDSRYLCWSSSGDDIYVSVSQKILQCSFGISDFLKCHWDQNFGIPYFYIFEHSLWFFVTMPNFNLLRRLEVAFFGRFFSRFCGRHYWPLFRKLACE